MSVSVTSPKSEPTPEDNPVPPRAMGLTRRLHALWARYGGRAEPLLVLAGVYAVQFIFTRLSVKTSPVPAVQAIGWFPAYLFKGWDGGFYVLLARRYDSYAWPPLYPFALRAVGWLVGNAIDQAAVLVNLASHLAIVLLAYAFVRGNPRLREVPTWFFATLILFFPGHNVFFAVYSESLFLAFALGACVAYQRERLWLAGLLCGVSLLVRNMGMFLGVALVMAELWRAWSERRFNVRRLAGVSVWVLFFVGWNVWLREVAGTDPVTATAGWQQELVKNHVPAGMNPKLWVLEYLALPGHKEPVFFWATLAAAVYCWVRRLRVEALFIAVFLLSFAVYLYRPFPFSRYTSVLFPLALMAADALKRAPILQAFAVASAAALAQYYQVLLFTMRIGEP